MNKSRWTWWTVVAAVIALGELIVGIGIAAETSEALGGRVIGLVAMVSFAALIALGLAIRPTRRATGSAAIGVGTLPGCLGIVLFWFPPDLAVGLLSIVITVMAFGDAAESRAIRSHTWNV